MFKRIEQRVLRYTIFCSLPELGNGYTLVALYQKEGPPIYLRVLLARIVYSTHVYDEGNPYDDIESRFGNKYKICMGVIYGKTNTPITCLDDVSDVQLMVTGSIHKKETKNKAAAGREGEEELGISIQGLKAMPRKTTLKGRHVTVYFAKLVPKANRRKDVDGKDATRKVCVLVVDKSWKNFVNATMNLVFDDVKEGCIVGSIAYMCKDVTKTIQGIRYANRKKKWIRKLSHREALTWYQQSQRTSRTSRKRSERKVKRARKVKVRVKKQRSYNPFAILESLCDSVDDDIDIFKKTRSTQHNRHGAGRKNKKKKKKP